MSIRIRFLGTGGVFDWKYGNSSAVVDTPSGRMLIDCGPSVYASLRQYELIDDISYILITHLHGDHVGSLFPLILHLNSRAQPQRKARFAVPTEAFRRDICGLLGASLPSYSDFIEFVDLQSVKGVGFIDTTGRHVRDLPSFAYYFTDDQHLLYYSGDLGDVQVTADFLATRKEKHIRVFHEIHFRRGAEHTHYSDIMKVLSAYEVYGYHVDPAAFPPDNTIPLVANQPEFVLPPLWRDDGTGHTAG